MFQGQAGNHPRELWTSQPDEMMLNVPIHGRTDAHLVRHSEPRTVFQDRSV
jgi:hypothetical protein